MKWEEIKMYDLTCYIGVGALPAPTYQSLSLEYSKRLSSDGENVQIIHTSNNIGTYLDGGKSFFKNASDIAEIPLDKLYHPGVIVDISDDFCEEDYGVYTSADIERRVEVKEGDILIINTGYHNYGWGNINSDEPRYMMRHPGPDITFPQWCCDKHLRWIGIDCPSVDHPLNTDIRKLYPFEAQLCNEYMKRRYGKTLEEMYPWPEQYNAMHLQLLNKKYGEIIHVEGLGGEIDEISNKRLVIGCFPWKGVDIESAFCRVIAFEGFDGV